MRLDLSTTDEISSSFVGVSLGFISWAEGRAAFVIANSLLLLRPLLASIPKLDVCSRILEYYQSVGCMDSMVNAVLGLNRHKTRRDWFRR